jgi:hypothetical protein
VAAGEVFAVSAVFSDHEQMVTQPGIELSLLPSRTRTIESSSPPHLPRGRPSTASGHLAAASSSRE